MTPYESMPFTRRDLLTFIGKSAGGAAMYQAMTALGHASESTFKCRPRLEGAKKGASVLILGAGVAGMVAAYELRNAGYKVTILEYANRAGGRCWTLRGGDRYEELGGAVQQCNFAEGEYFNPGPWRIPYHHHAVLCYCKLLGVQLEPFIQVNYNAFVHSSGAYDGNPQRYRHVQADFQGYIAELLSKAANKGALDSYLKMEDKEKLLDGLKDWGALDSQYRYLESIDTSDRRGFEIDPGGGLMPKKKASKPLGLHGLLQSELWTHIKRAQDYEVQSTIFQPVGGMDMIAKAFQREVGDLIRFNAKVTEIDQIDNKVIVTYIDELKKTNGNQVVKADWCLCTIPLSILSRLKKITVGNEMREAINAVPYAAAFKIGLQFKRRFWEEDDAIYGGISYTDLPINRIAYPSTRYGASGKSVLLGGYMFGPNAYEFTAMTPEDRIKWALAQGSKIHPQYQAEYDHTGISVGWHRNPGSMGCAGEWTEDARKKHYYNLCKEDRQIFIAGEHASDLPAWMEGALLSSLDAIERLHARASI